MCVCAVVLAHIFLDHTCLRVAVVWLAGVDDGKCVNIMKNGLYHRSYVHGRTTARAYSKCICANGVAVMQHRICIQCAVWCLRSVRSSGVCMHGVIALPGTSNNDGVYMYYITLHMYIHVSRASDERVTHFFRAADNFTHALFTRGRREALRYTSARSIKHVHSMARACVSGGSAAAFHTV